MSISRVFSQVPGTHYRQLPRPSPMVPRPKNLERKKKQFFKDVLPDARKRGKTSGVCVQVNGEWSSGKTLFLAFIQLERLEEEGLGGICNFPVKGPLMKAYEFLNDDFKRIDHETGDTLYGIEALSEVFGKIIAIDEFQRYADSYMSKSQKALFVSNLVADFGKQGNDLYFTNQHHNVAPTRVKVNISFVVYPQYDERSGWVHVYCFHSIQQFLWKNPFWYFGFYAPDYWDYYDTLYKVEDYVMKFRPETYIRKFYNWMPERKIRKKQVKVMGQKKLRQTIKLFDAVEGHDLASNEISLIMTEMEYTGLWNGT